MFDNKTILKVSPVANILSENKHPKSEGNKLYNTRINKTKGKR